MDEFEKIRAFSEELGKKTEEAIVAENDENIEVPEPKEEGALVEESTENADFLENWSNSTENTEEVRHLSKTFWIVLSVVTLLLALLIVVIYLLLKGPMENDEPVIIAPTQKPVKMRPENPGGMVIPDQDKVIYSRITQDTIPTKVEKLFPEEEKPVMPQVVEEPLQDAAQEEKVVVEEVEPEEIEVILMTPEEVKPQEKTQPISEGKSVEKKTKQPQKAVETPKRTWKVQLASLTSKAKVEKEWQSISQKHKALVSDMPMQIVSAEIPGKGTFYRLQVGAFETEQMAINLCAKLKKQKQDCIPVR